MSNMSYCRFQNTLHDLDDCLDHLEDDNLSREEKRAKTQLISRCREILELLDYDVESPDERAVREDAEFDDNDLDDKE